MQTAKQVGHDLESAQELKLICLQNSQWSFLTQFFVHKKLIWSNACGKGSLFCPL